MFITYARRLCTRGLIALACLSTIGNVQADEAADSLAQLQGSWKVISITFFDGDKMQVIPAPPNAKFQFQGNKLVDEFLPREADDPPDANVSPITLDVTTSPKQMVINKKEIIRGGAPGQKPAVVGVKEVQRKAIYAIDGNRLRLCMIEGGGTTVPKDFPVAGTAVDKPTGVLLLERETAAK